jgi:phosphoserine phosphatase RsbU/P
MAQRILIIEDEAPIRMMLSEALGDEGYAVATAATVDAGITMLPTVQPHLILCDLMFPRKNGREFYERLTADPAFATVPVVFMTALQPVSADERYIGDLQHVPTLYKPINLNELLTAVAMFIAPADS